MPASNPQPRNEVGRFAPLIDAVRGWPWPCAVVSMTLLPDAAVYAAKRSGGDRLEAIEIGGVAA